MVNRDAEYLLEVMKHLRITSQRLLDANKYTQERVRILKQN